MELHSSLFFSLYIPWLVFAVTMTVILVRRKLEAVTPAIILGGLAALVFPPASLLYMLVLTLLPDR